MCIYSSVIENTIEEINQQVHNDGIQGGPINMYMTSNKKTKQNKTNKHLRKERYSVFL